MQEQPLWKCIVQVVCWYSVWLSGAAGVGGGGAGGEVSGENRPNISIF